MPQILSFTVSVLGPLENKISNGRLPHQNGCWAPIPVHEYIALTVASEVEYTFASAGRPKPMRFA